MGMVSFAVEREPQIEQMRREIIELRSAGEVLFETRHIESQVDSEHGDDLAQIVDSFVVQMGCKGLGKWWREIGLASARRILLRVLHRDLAYNAEIMDVENANRLAESIFNLFGNARYFTNGEYDRDPIQTSASTWVGPRWTPITDATFDTGVICVSHERIGMLWVKDED